MLPSHGRRRATILSLLMSCAVSAPAVAQDGALDIGAQIRVRGEAIGGDFKPGRQDADERLGIQTLVTAEYALGPVTLGVELLDARDVGDDDLSATSAKNVNALEPLQAYVALDLDNAAGADTLRLLAGRYTLKIGSQRLVGRGSFGDVYTSYAGGYADWRSGDTRAIAFYGAPFVTLPGDADGVRDADIELDRTADATDFFGFSVTQGDIFAGLDAEAYIYRLAEGEDDAAHQRLVTVGTRILRKPAPGTVDFEVEMASQLGSSVATPGGADNDVRAAFGHAELGTSFDWSKLRTAAIFDYASGDDPRTPTVEGFDKLYGVSRSSLNPTGLYGALKYGNLVSLGALAEAKPAKGWDMFVKARLLWLDDKRASFSGTKVRDSSGQSGNYAGAQVEARVRTWLVPDRLRLDAGGAYLAKGRFLKDAPNAPDTGDTRYAYLALELGF